MEKPVPGSAPSIGKFLFAFIVPIALVWIAVIWNPSFNTSSRGRPAPKMDNLHHVPEAPKEFEIERLGGYFKNELEDYSAANKKGLAVGYVSENTSLDNFGIISRDYDGESEEDKSLPQWERLGKHLKRLNDGAKPGEQYRLLIMSRHGQGLHNAVAEAVGISNWTEYWSLLDNTLESERVVEGVSDRDINLVDPSLTDLGVTQARSSGKQWRDGHVPRPKIIYSSPLRRCIQTARHIHSVVNGGEGAVSFHVMEMLRERIVNHPCDRRSSYDTIVRSFAHDDAPGWKISKPAIKPDELPEPGAAGSEDRKWRVELEDGFRRDATDPYWNADDNETFENVGRRAMYALNDILATGDPTDKTKDEKDRHDVVTLAIHSGLSKGFLQITNHPVFWQMYPGETFPILIRAKAVV